ncbi:MAG: hypothetical protein H0T42_22200 [Deltaproteobacteria bacterium]|nr:hypothetical protein [Deltaproteobacteria bacterium]
MSDEHKTGRVLEQGTRSRIIALNSSAGCSDALRDAVVVCGSHGAPNSCLYVMKFGPAAAIFHDAGKGKENYAISCLGLFDKERIPCASADGFSARIGDSIDMFECGILSAVNDTAAALGLRVGMPVKQAAQDLLAHLDRG